MNLDWVADRFRLLGAVGKGNMGEVHRAEDHQAAEDAPEAAGASQATHHEIVRLRDQYRFFHWHLEFPEIFSVPEDGRSVSEATGWAGGFDCVLGNPPWDSVELKEQEFFAQRSPVIAAVSKADARKKLIAKLKEDSDTLPLYKEYAAAKRKVYAESHFLRRSGRVPLTGQGNLNTYAVFSETDRILMGAHGRTGIIVPTGIATDARTQYFFKDLVQSGAIAALFDFENAAPLFPEVHRSFKFSILSLTGPAIREPAATFAFFLHDPSELDDANKAFTLTPEEITLLNPNTGTCPVFRSRRDAEITLDIYRRVPILIRERDGHGQEGRNPWGMSFLRMFDMAHDSALFRDPKDLEAEGWTLTSNIFTKNSAKMLPLYEAKMLHHYDHRWATYEHDGTTHDLNLTEKQDSSAVAQPRYWVSEHEVKAKLATKGWDRRWLIGWRDICRSTDERTTINSVAPIAAIGHPFPIMCFSKPDLVPLLCTQLSSFAFDYVARQKIGGTHLTYGYITQLPVLRPSQSLIHLPFLSARALELTFTAHDLTPFARDLGDSGNPFRWHQERRTVIRAELDAFFFHLYGISRDDAAYILDTFPIVRRKDEAKYGTFRAKDLILSEYDRMATAGVNLSTPLVDGENFTSTLTPPPGHGPRHDPNRT